MGLHDAFIVFKARRWLVRHEKLFSSFDGLHAYQNQQVVAVVIKAVREAPVIDESQLLPKALFLIFS